MRKNQSAIRAKIRSTPWAEGLQLNVGPPAGDAPPLNVAVAYEWRRDGDKAPLGLNSFVLAYQEDRLRTYDVTMKVSMKENQEVTKDVRDFVQELVQRGSIQDALEALRKDGSFEARGEFPIPPAVVPPDPVTMVSLTRNRTSSRSDWVLHYLIKQNAKNLSWSKYTEAIDMIFTGTLDDRARSLANRRFLPFSDTDSYRALKVGTEAFVMVNGLAFDRDPGSSFRDEGVLELFDRGEIQPPSPAKSGPEYFESYMAKKHVDGKDIWLLPYLAQVLGDLGDSQVAANVKALLNQAAAEAKKDPVDQIAIWKETKETKLAQPLVIELIWSYWLEEMQLVQAMNAISMRFQNMSPRGGVDPLAQLEISPLRPLNNFMWGWAQDEQHRLTIARRAYEYSHHYGLSLIGKAVPPLRPADHRSKFLEAFHTLLNLCTIFFRQADDTTVKPDGFPILNAAREVHLLLAEGGHNQFRDLPTTARIEMLMQQWILARPEFKEFLPRRAMVNYPEEWMHSVAAVRKLQGWDDTNVLHFWQLATCGEQIVASLRWGSWTEEIEPDVAANWAKTFRSEIQMYIHAYRAVTGVDISAEPVDALMPGIHLMRRLTSQRRRVLA